MRASSSGSAALRYGSRDRRPRAARTTRLERATPRVSATTFTGNRPSAATASARSFFCLRPAQRLLQDLDFHGLAAQQPLELANAILQTAHLRAAHHRLVRSHRSGPALVHQAAPTIN